MAAQPTIRDRFNTLDRMFDLALITITKEDFSPISFVQKMVKYVDSCFCSEIHWVFEQHYNGEEVGFATKEYEFTFPASVVENKQFDVVLSALEKLLVYDIKDNISVKRRLN